MEHDVTVNRPIERAFRFSVVSNRATDFGEKIPSNFDRVISSAIPSFIVRARPRSARTMISGTDGERNIEKTTNYKMKPSGALA